MKSFTISPELRWYTAPQSGERRTARFVNLPTRAFYHADYHGGNEERRQTIGTVENIITTLKNQFGSENTRLLFAAQNSLVQILREDLSQIQVQLRMKKPTVCVIPRAKTESSYSQNQRLFRKGVQVAVKELDDFIDGTNFILRKTNTRTTHLNKSGYGGDGDMPYPGITKETCIISNDVKGKEILLIDDLYTETINIDEDAIQALIDFGANSVVFYALGKTVARPY